LSALSSFDLQVPGDDYSMMNVFARYGFDVWTMDHEGFGRSAQTSGTSDIGQPGRRSQRDKIHMFGGSSGAIAAAFAQAEPERIDRLMLAAFTYKGEGAAEIARRRARIDELRASPRRKRDAAMIRSIFTRDGHSSLYDPAMVEALVTAEMPNGDSVPSGSYVDMAVNLPLVDPAKVRAPVLMTRGEWDGNSTDSATCSNSSARCRMAIVNTSSCRTRPTARVSKNRQLLWYAMNNFLNAPAAGRVRKKASGDWRMASRL
jgi:pimeloyl-ACP methyl ester carboxylesterase